MTMAVALGLPYDQVLPRRLDELLAAAGAKARVMERSRSSSSAAARDGRRDGVPVDVGGGRTVVPIRSMETLARFLRPATLPTKG